MKKLTKEELEIINLALEKDLMPRHLEETKHLSKEQQKKLETFFRETKRYLPYGIEILMGHRNGETSKLSNRAINLLAINYNWNIDLAEIDYKEEDPFYNRKIALVLIPKLIRYKNWPRLSSDRELFFDRIEKYFKETPEGEAHPNLVAAMEMFFPNPNIIELLFEASEHKTKSFFSFVKKNNLELDSTSIKILANIKNTSSLIREYVLDHLPNVDSSTLYDIAKNNNFYYGKISQNANLHRKLRDNKETPVAWLAEMDLKHQRYLDSKVSDNGKIRRCDLEELLKAANLIEHDLHESRGVGSKMRGFWYSLPSSTSTVTSNGNNESKENLKSFLGPKKEAIATFLYYELDFNIDGYLTEKGFKQICTYVVTCFYKSNLSDHDKILTKLQEAMKDPRFDEMKTKLLPILSYWKRSAKEYAQFVSKEVASGKDAGVVIKEFCSMFLDPLPSPPFPTNPFADKDFTSYVPCPNEYFNDSNIIPKPSAPPSTNPFADQDFTNYVPCSEFNDEYYNDPSIITKPSAPSVLVTQNFFSPPAPLVSIGDKSSVEEELNDIAMSLM